MTQILGNSCSDPDQFRRLLDEHYDWPAPYTFKFIVPAKRLDELGRFSLHLFHKLDRSMHFAHVEQNVNVIGDSPNDNVRRIEIANHRSKISMNTRSDFVIQEWFAVFCAENQMRIQLGERLRHRESPFPT